jgi:hypothetical protein
MKPWMPALAGMLAIVAVILADLMLLGVPFVRNGWWTYGPLAAALGLCIFAVSKQRGAGTIIPAVLGVLLVGLYTFTRFMSAPAAPAALAVGQPFPDATHEDEQGRSVRIGAEAQKGPLVVVFFRGHW